MRSLRPVHWFLGPLGLLVCLAGEAALAQTDKAARDELDRQLREMVGKPPTRVKITFMGLDEPSYSVVEAVITLDGQPLQVPTGAVLSKEGEHLIFQGDYQPGDHRVEAKVTIADAGGVMFSYQNGYKWKVGVARTFNLQPGLEVAVVFTPTRDGSATQTKDKFKLSSTAVPRMLAALDDGSMPEPPSRVKVAAAEPDAGAVTLSAADEKKRKAEEAAAAKAAAAEEKQRLAEEAKAAKLAAAEEKKRLAEEARAAKLAAAEEKKAMASGKLPARPVGEGGAVAPPEIAPAVPEVDAGAPEPVDAGAPLVAPPPAVVARKLPPVEPQATEGTPWVVIGAGVGVLIALLILLARRRSNPRDPGV